MTEKELIDGIITKDKTAVQLLVSRYHQQVIKTAYYFVKDMDDAEDLAQEVYMEVLDSIPSFRQTSSLSTWLYRITVNKSLNQIRKNKRRNIFERFEDMYRSTFDRGEAEPYEIQSRLDDHERKRVLDNAIQNLPRNQRIAFILSKYENLPQKQIAEVMKTTLPAVESYLQRARKNLQKQLSSYFLEYSSKNHK